MHYRNLGQSGLRVSNIGLGIGLISGDLEKPGELERCLLRAHDHGVNLFDTASVYDQGQSETVLGSVLASRPRHSYVLATKVFSPPGAGPNESGLGRKHLIEELENTLKRLAVDYVDLYQCHQFDRQTPLEETCRAMDDLVRQGKILYWGMSQWTADQVARTVELCLSAGWAPPVSNQLPLNALERTAERDVLGVCERLGVGVMAFAPLAQGVLTGKYPARAPAPAGSRMDLQSGSLDRPRDDVLSAIARLAPVSARLGCSLTQMALAWVLSHSEVSTTLVGASSVEQVEHNLAAIDVDLKAEVITQIDWLLEGVSQR